MMKNEVFFNFLFLIFFFSNSKIQFFVLVYFLQVIQIIELIISIAVRIRIIQLMINVNCIL